jgi:nucleotide-binding universal stress UspA family protein
VRASGLLLEGLPVQEIVRTAKSMHIGIIAMGTHGRIAFAMLFIGSVAQRVVGAAPCPALRVRNRSAPGARTFASGRRRKLRGQGQ